LNQLNRIILDYGAKDKVFYTGLTFTNVIENKEKLVGSKYFLNLDAQKWDITKLNNKEYLVELFNEFDTLNIMGINVNYKNVTPELISVCKENRLLCSIWTVDEIEVMKRMIDLKVNSITTKKIDLLKSLVELALKV
jgi:glycerophosphoryl diester phosphodiesterase